MHSNSKFYAKIGTRKHLFMDLEAPGRFGQSGNFRHVSSMMIAKWKLLHFFIDFVRQSQLHFLPAMTRTPQKSYSNMTQYQLIIRKISSVVQQCRKLKYPTETLTRYCKTKGQGSSSRILRANRALMDCYVMYSIP